MARLSPEQGRIIGDNLFICWVLIIFNGGGGNGLTKCSNIHKFIFSPPILFVFPVDLLIDLFYSLPQGVEPHMRCLPSLSVSFSHHPTEVRHTRGGGKVASSYYFAARPIVLRAQSTIAPKLNLYWSVRRAIVLFVQSTTAR